MATRSTVSRKFSEQVHRAPDALAVKGDRAMLTYRQLENCANHLTHRLVEAGVAPGDCVPMCLPRSVNAVITMLAIIKAGGAFVPVDPAYPHSLMRERLTQSGARHVVLANEDAGGWVGARVQPIPLGDVLAARDADGAPIDRSNDDEKAVYVMFTSGSTGGPKGVMVPHRGVVRLVCDSDYVRVDPRDTLLLFSPITFDASTFEIWGALLNGARLVVWEDSIFDPNRLAARVREEKISVMWLTAGLFHLIARRHIDLFSGLRVLLAGGDVLQARAVNAVLDACPGITVVNGYGPTENTTFTCCHPMTRASRPGDKVPIGRAICGTEVHILDDRMQPVPDGEEGELWAGGLGVALGYLNAPAATEAAFVRHPATGATLYRTGDLVRRNAAGLIEFIGRRDGVTKIRGFRVSVEDIQAQIARIPGVEENIVVVRTDGNGEKRLEAFVQTSDRRGNMAGFIRGEMRKAVPAFMVPDQITICSELPLNANGKVDRRSTVSMTAIAGENHV